MSRDRRKELSVICANNDGPVARTPCSRLTLHKTFTAYSKDFIKAVKELYDSYGAKGTANYLNIWGCKPARGNRFNDNMIKNIVKDL